MKKIVNSLLIVAFLSAQYSFSIKEIDLPEEESSTETELQTSAEELKERKDMLKKEIAKLNLEKRKTDKIIKRLQGLQKELGDITSSLRTMRRKK
jgi:DNA-binding transcriptional MerR regulator